LTIENEGDPAKDAETSNDKCPKPKVGSETFWHIKNPSPQAAGIKPPSQKIKVN
jgi:hypothetical protein